MKFKVHGANPQTGDEFDFDVDAATIQEAEAKAQQAEMLVSSVIPADAPSTPAPPPTVVIAQQPRRGCPHCGGKVYRTNVGRSLYRTKVGRSNTVGIIRGLAMIVAGLLFLLIPVIGWIIGAVLIIAGLLSGGKSRKVLRCRSCKAVIAETA